MAASFPPDFIEIVFSFDTTGSMSSILDEVKGRLNDMIQRLQADIPGIRLGVIAHGDYCDKDVFYLTRQQDLTTDIATLCNFVNSTEGTGGGDPDECYELVLRKIRTEFDWTTSAQKIAVVIGDANPHEPDYDMNVDNIDWRKETRELYRMGVKVYGVQAFENEDAEDFYRTMAEDTDGSYLKLGSFSNICDFLMAICYRERGEEFLNVYETEVRHRMKGKGINNEMEGMFGELHRSASIQSQSSLTTVPSLISKVSSSSANSKVSSLKSFKRNLSLKSTSSIASLSKLGIAPEASRKKSSKKDKPTGDNNIRIGKPKIQAVTKVKREKPNNRNAAGQRKTKQHKRNISKSSNFTLRENVPARKFKFKNLKWSRWKLVFTPVKPENTKPKSWSNKPNLTNGGWKNVRIFQEKTAKSAFYEFSVQTKPRGKRYVMFGKIIHAQNRHNNWEKTIKGKMAKIMLGSVLKRNCKIFIRRALITEDKGQRIAPLKEYSYAWSFDSRKQSRAVERGSVVISEPHKTK